MEIIPLSTFIHWDNHVRTWTELEEWLNKICKEPVFKRSHSTPPKIELHAWIKKCNLCNFKEISRLAGLAMPVKAALHFRSEDLSFLF